MGAMTDDIPIICLSDDDQEDDDDDIEIQTSINVNNLKNVNTNQPNTRIKLTSTENGRLLSHSPRVMYYRNIDYEQIALSPALRRPSQAFSGNRDDDQDENDYTINSTPPSTLSSSAGHHTDAAAPVINSTPPPTLPSSAGHHTNAAAAVITSSSDASMRYVGIDGDASQQNNGDDADLKRTDFEHSAKLEATFARYFKFKGFRKNQFEAINAALLGYDTLILMPTGGGKSICYQLPAVVASGVTIVVSPLKSLIEDQVNKLRSLNIRASALSSETSAAEQDEIYYDLKTSQPLHKLLYVTPEKLSKSGLMLSVLKQLYNCAKLDRFVIDEAHCVSQWGFDFRPDYNKLGVLRDEFPHVPIMALTATAPPKVRIDIMQQLRIRQDKNKVFIQSFNRPNIKFEVRKKAGKNNSTSDIIHLIDTKFKNQSGIIYCLSRNDCETVAAELRENGIKSVPYHAGLDATKRRNVQSGWDSNKCNVICATIAFGMGIDKPDVRFVIHYSIPKSIEGYYQEAGRAGRDGQFAHCILYYSGADIQRMKHMLRGNRSLKANNGQSLDQLNLHQIGSYCQNSSECRRAYLLRYLGENFDPANCIGNRATACDNCLKAHNRNNMLSEVDEDVYTGPTLGDRINQAKLNKVRNNYKRVYTNSMRLAQSSAFLPSPKVFLESFISSYDDNNVMDSDFAHLVKSTPTKRTKYTSKRAAATAATARNKAMAESMDSSFSPSSLYSRKTTKKYVRSSPATSTGRSEYFVKQQERYKTYKAKGSESSSMLHDYQPLGPMIATTSVKRRRVVNSEKSAMTKKPKTESVPPRINYSSFVDLPPF